MDINIQQYRTRIGLFNLCGPKKVKKWRYYQEKIYQKSPNNLFNCTATILIYGLLISDYFLCQNRVLLETIVMLDKERDGADNYISG